MTFEDALEAAKGDKELYHLDQYLKINAPDAERDPYGKIVIFIRRVQWFPQQIAEIIRMRGDSNCRNYLPYQLYYFILFDK